MIEQYIIESHMGQISDLPEFQAKIQSLLDQGWEPQGGIQIVPINLGTQYLFAQAMVLESEDEELGPGEVDEAPSRW